MNDIKGKNFISRGFFTKTSFVDRLYELAHRNKRLHFLVLNNVVIMLQFLFNPLGRVAQHEFVLGWLFWLTLELGFFFGLWGATQNSPASFYWFLTLTAISGASTISVVMLGVKRLRDAAMPVWPAAILLVPVVSLIALVVMSNMPSRNKRQDV